ncbi:MAG: hypothetical protein KME05_08120 [Gloeocapsa sp. UFS-A4-WI-NPMV-4B04]|jgi:hypothetical protein|nr:hypothetical protein [Gloeocapsa sp. UFS-A4-WI-NPMV-4B04]
MLRRLVVGVVTAGLALSTIEVQPAQSRDSCQVAIAEAKYKIESKNTRVVQFNKFDMSKESESPEYPEKYPIRVSMIIDGSGAESIMNSTVFLKALSHKIIMGCKPVSLVEFGMNHTDWSNTFGLLGENKIEEFECLDPGFNNRIPWGYTVCL